MHSCICFCVFAFLSLSSQIVYSLTTCVDPGPKNETGPVFRTSENNSTLWYECEGVSTTLQCHVNGFTAVHWYIQRNNTWKSISSVFNPGRFELKKADRCLTFPLPFIEAHSGQYKCVAKDNQGHSITNTFEVLFHKCGDGNFHISKRPPKRILRLPGTHVTMSCSGAFGDSDVTAEDIQWIYRNGSRSHLVKYHLGERFKVTEGTKSVESGLLTLTANLEISNIRESDYRDYTCIISSQHDTRRQDNATTSLVNGDPSDPNGLKLLFKRLGIGVGVLVFVLLVLGVIGWKRHVDIKLWWMYRWKPAPPSDDKKHDVAVIFNENNGDDEDFVETELKPGLLKFGFSICDDRLGYSNMQNYINALDTSRRFVIVLTPEALSTTWCQMKSEEVLQEYGKSILFIVLRPIDKETWKRDEHSRGIKKAMKIIKKTVRVPSKSSNMGHFWKELRLLLPVVQTKDSSRRVRDTSRTSSTTSTRPLLNSDYHTDSGKGSSDISVTSTSSDGKRGSNGSACTPIDDEVFHYGNGPHFITVLS